METNQVLGKNLTTELDSLGLLLSFEGGSMYLRITPVSDKIKAIEANSSKTTLTERRRINCEKVPIIGAPLVK